MALEWNPTTEEFTNEFGELHFPDPKLALDLSSQELIGNSYNNIRIHEHLVKDEARVGLFKNAILENRSLFNGKTVLNVGAGSGFLSMLAAQAGARRVIGIEETNMAHIAGRAVWNAPANLYQIISIVKGRVENLPKLPGGVDKVDIILCDPVGYGLFYESTFQAVIYARDKWLKQDGIIFPDTFSLYMAGLEDMDHFNSTIGPWDLWGVGLNLNFEYVKKCKVNEAIVRNVDPKNIVTTYNKLITLDLHTTPYGYLLNFIQPFCLSATKDATINAFVTFFLVQFTKSKKPFWFSNSPHSDSTVWKQMHFNTYPLLELKMGDEIHGQYGMEQKSQNKRDIEFKIKYNFIGEDLKEIDEERKYRITMI